MTFSEKDLKRAGEKSKNSCGRRCDVGGQRMNKRQIAEYFDLSPGYVHDCLEKESIEHFVKRMRK